MLKNFRDKIALSGITVLMVGVALLVFTFLSAYGFLTQNLSIGISEDMLRTFGEALAPLIVTCIRIMYLGVMGWIGSLLTIRGVTIIAHTPATATTVVPQKLPTPVQAKPQPQKEKTEEPIKKPAASEPQFVVVPPEQATTTQAPSQPQEKEQKNNSQPPS